MQPSSNDPESIDPSLDGFDFAVPPMDDLHAQMNQRFKQPDWFGPPTNWLPALVPLELTLARTDDVIVHLSGIRAFPTGFAFHLLASLRDPRPDIDQGMFGPAGMFHGSGVSGGGALPDELLRFAFVHADGATASSLGGPPMGLPDTPDAAPEGPLLMQGGGGGGGGDYRWDYWHWPLPSPGTTRIVCEWPAAGIERVVTSFDTTPFVEAAGRAEQLWPDPPDFPHQDGANVRVF